MSRFTAFCCVVCLGAALFGCGEAPGADPESSLQDGRSADSSTDPNEVPPTDAQPDPNEAPPGDSPTDPDDPPRGDQPTDPNDPPPVDPPTDPNDPPPVDPPTDPDDPPPDDPQTDPSDAPPSGNGDGHCSVPAEAQEEDVSNPDTVIGDGTPASCTSNAFVEAVAQGGVITFNCGPDPVVITLDRTAKVFNDQNPDIVIDGGGKVTLSGGGRVRILYQNACDPDQVWTTSHCPNQDHPRLTVQNLTFVDGNAKSEEDGGGAIFARGGSFKVVNSRFFNNVCHDVGPDVGGGAIRVFDQYQDRPAYVVNSTFGGEGLGNVCSNGGALSSIGVSYTVINSTLTHNDAIGYGANPQDPGTPGGGSGGAIYNDGNTFTLTVCGTRIANNTANEGGGAIFFVSNDRSGTLIIEDSVLENNPSDGFETQGYPGIFYLGNGDPQVTNSVIR